MQAADCVHTRVRGGPERSFSQPTQLVCIPCCPLWRRNDFGAVCGHALHVLVPWWVSREPDCTARGCYHLAPMRRSRELDCNGQSNLAIRRLKLVLCKPGWPCCVACPGGCPFSQGGACAKRCGRVLRRAGRQSGIDSSHLLAKRIALPNFLYLFRFCPPLTGQQGSWRVPPAQITHCDSSGRN